MIADVDAICDEFGWRLVGKHEAPGPGQTRAGSTIRKIFNQDEALARITMQTLSDTANNRGSLEREVIGATFDLAGACDSYFKAEPEKWFQVWDLCPVGELQAIAHDLRGFVPLRPALAGMIYERIWRAYGPRSVQPDLLDDRRMPP